MKKHNLAVLHISQSRLAKVIQELVLNKYDTHVEAEFNKESEQLILYVYKADVNKNKKNRELAKKMEIYITGIINMANYYNDYI